MIRVTRRHNKDMVDKRKKEQLIINLQYIVMMTEIKEIDKNKEKGI